jgi:hypothetical protein
MKKHINLIKTGFILAGIGTLVIIYNFFNMYSLVAKCQNDIPAQSCKALNSWEFSNYVGFVLLLSGVIVIVIGYVKQKRS